MKLWYATLPLLASVSQVVTACDVDMPNIIMSVQFAGRGDLGTQRSSEFMVPLYSGSDCEYLTFAAPVQAGGSIPMTAVSANFPGDGFGFTGSNGLSLDSNSLSTFIDFLSSYAGTSLDANSLLGLVICTVIGSDGTKYSFGPTQTLVFNAGAPILVASYRCAVELGA